MADTCSGLIGVLDEECGNNGCQYIKFSAPNCCQGANASGCDGQICVFATGNPPDCLCNDPSFDFFGITVYPLNSGDSGGGYQNLDCEGKARYTLNQCGEFVWEHRVPSDPIFTYCYETTSGTFNYTYGGEPGSCERQVPIYINFKNHWCEVPWTEDIGVYETFENLITDRETSSDILIDYTTDECPHTNNIFDGNTVSKTFCTTCTTCTYQVIITICNGQTGGEVNIELPGTHNGPTDSTEYMAVVGGTGPTCAIACKTTEVTGVVYRGKHYIEFAFGRSLTSYIPAGSSLEANFKWLDCKSECDLCKCNKLEDDVMYYEWTDYCFGYSGTKGGAIFPYNNSEYVWESSCHYDSGNNRSTRFYLVCRENCWDDPEDNHISPPRKIPFKPLDLTSDPDHIYLYEFYQTGPCSTDAEAFAPNWDSDYYIWKPTNDCNPLNFERAWKKCNGVVSEESLACEHSFKLYSECLSGNTCDTCNVNVCLWYEDSHIPFEGWYEVWREFKIQDGRIGPEGCVRLEFPSGDAPWWFLWSGDCVETGSGLVYCDGVGPLYDYPYVRLKGNPIQCVIHSGACTLCQGEPIPAILYLTDNFGENTDLNWNGSAWIGSGCFPLDACFETMEGTCVELNSGSVFIQYELGCWEDGFRFMLTMPWRGCDCGSGCPCIISPIPQYINTNCSQSIDSVYDLSSGCSWENINDDFLSRRYITFYEASGLGQFNYDCKPIDMDIFDSIYLDSGCEDTMLIRYVGQITE